MAGGKCAPRSKTTPQTEAERNWALANFGGANLGDPRRNKRLVALAGALAENPGMSLPKQLPDGSDLTGAYRLLSNPRVDPQAILASHGALTRQAAGAEPVVLCVQDDTTLDFTLRTGITGLGIIGDGRGRGLLQHSALAVLPDKRVLGILDIAWHALQKAPAGEKRRERQGRWNAPDVWQEAAQRIGPWPAGPVGSQLIHVGDRASDLFRFMHAARQLGHGFVLRAMHERYVDGDQERLWAKLARQEPLGQMTVTLGGQRNKANRIKRAGREAVLTLRVAPVQVGPAANDLRTADAPPLSLYAVYLVEEHPPAGEEPVEWMLITSLEVPGLADARRVISCCARKRRS